MSNTPTVHRYSTTDFVSATHADEFIVVIDSLGRHWNPLKHPRDENGRFIRTFSFVTFDLPGGGTASGRVSGIDRDGNLLVKVEGTTPGADPRIDENGYVKVPHDKVAVRTVKAQLGGKGAAGILQKQENVGVTTSINSLRQMGMDEQADKLTEAQRLAMKPPKPGDPASRAEKERAIALFREVGEEVGDERGKGFKEGDDYDEIKANLEPEEVTRLQGLDDVIKNSYTARHSLGDNTIDVETSQGQLQGNMPEVRIEAAENQLSKDYAEDAKVWDITSGSLVEGQLDAPVKAEVRDTAAEPQTTEGLPEFWRSAYQKLRSGVDRLTGSKQAQQVAPGDRHHVDKNDDQVRVGMIVDVDATKSRGAFTGMVTRIYTDDKKNKHVYVRDFDPATEKGYTKTAKNADGTKSQVPVTYKDHSVQGKSIEIASDDQQSTLFQQLSLQGQDEASKSLVKSFTDEYIAAMQRRYATPGALKVSATSGFFDVTPIHLRQKKDANGQKVGIGDAVSGPNGEDGFVSYLEPNANTAKVYWRNGKSSRITASKLTRDHGATSEVYPDESGPNTNNYVPTREEAAQVAEEKGADSVAQVIRDGGDAHAIQAAMVTDVPFQSSVDDVDALYNKRDRTRAAGQELSEEDRTELDKWDRMFMASAGYFREADDPPPTPPEVPEPETPGEAPQNPDNPTETITETGVTVREEDGNVIVDDNTEDPIPAEDQQAVDEAVGQAGGDQGGGADQPQQPEQPPEPDQPPEPEQPQQLEQPTGEQTLAQKVQSSIAKLVAEAQDSADITPTQRQQLDKWQRELDAAIAEQDGPGVVKALQGMTKAVNLDMHRKQLGQTRLRAVLNRANANGDPLHAIVQERLDAGDDIFSLTPLTRTERAAEPESETPEGVDPQVDAADNAMSETLLMDDGSTLVMLGDEEVNEGYYVIDPDTVTEAYQLTEENILNFLESTEGSSQEGFTVWFDEADGRYRMARVGIFDNEQDAADAARTSGSNQYVNISDGAVMNVALGGDQNLPAEAVEDPRSEERRVRTAGSGRVKSRSTSKQKQMLDHVAETSGDEEIGRITAAVKNGEEINGADASRLADVIDGMAAGDFAKPSDKGVASQMAHRLARAAGEEGARGYSSQNTALRRTSDVGISLSATAGNEQVRSLVTAARADIKSGDMQAAAQKFRQAADLYDEEGHSRTEPSTRAREHADRLDAMGGVTGPAAEGAPEQAPGQTPQTPQTPEAGGPATIEEALADAGVPEVVPITPSSLSDIDTERSREVSPVEFAALAVQGRDALSPRWDGASEPEITSGPVLEGVKDVAWESVQEEWGGVTIDAHHAQVIDPDQGFALTVKQPGMDTVTVPIGASEEEFHAGVDEAMRRFGADEGSPLWMDGAHLGVFRNEDTGTYDIDPVLVVDSQEEAEAIGAYTHNVGGAYNFADGLGYWPPHIAEGGTSGEGQAGPGEVARPGGEGGEAQPGVGPPGQGPAEPAGGGPEAPEVARVTEVLSDIDTVIEAERNTEDDTGPVGTTPQLEDAASMLNTIRGKVTAEGPYTQLPRDLRELADFIDGNWRGTDPSDATDRLRTLADELDAGPDAAAPGASEAPAGVPFSLRTTPLPSATF